MLDTHLKFTVTGEIESLQDGIFICSGLERCFIGEVIVFGSLFSNIRGIVMDFTEDRVKIVRIFGDFTKVKAGDLAYRTYQYFTTVAGFGLLGLAISIFGECLNIEDYSKEDIVSRYIRLDIVSVNNKAPKITHREAVRIPVCTGITSIDMLFPVGRGQRELILGDKGVGKTTLALTIILNQRKTNHLNHWRQLEALIGNEEFSRNLVPCFYVTIGQRRAEVARIKSLLIKKNAMFYTCIVCADGDAPAAVQYLSPYAACAMGEWFRSNAYGAIIVYDDLTQHAIAYRQISLLLRRPPGREAYPGDIFYIHSRLLERAAQLSNVLGGGSLTAFPIIETKSGDISAYIPTNVISITDGQIFLSKDIMNKGFRPAVNVRLSVSRVGSAAQVPAMVEVSKLLKRQYSMYKRYEGMDRLGGELDSSIMVYLIRGRKIDKYFVQDVYKTRSIYQSVVALYLLCSGLLDSIPLEWVTVFIKFIFNKRIILFIGNSKSIEFVMTQFVLEHLVESDSVSFLKEYFNELVSDISVYFKKLIHYLDQFEESNIYLKQLKQ